MSLVHNDGLRTFGVEEELLIVDPTGGWPLPLARWCPSSGWVFASGSGSSPTPALGPELGARTPATRPVRVFRRH
ncbi:hypothetical protein E3T53_04005 [Cryobacterium psychrophilum]|uniref:Uncharacterized protein n=1 Tax=Cryobacterium psychrophilum TaxID=41988 RepID=A0A4Y8KPU1_9MICO|nr:hypothetical protein E3T53_04005 [Cryobacterium psychrophilum]